VSPVFIRFHVHCQKNAVVKDYLTTAPDGKQYTVADPGFPDLHSFPTVSILEIVAMYLKETQQGGKGVVSILEITQSILNADRAKCCGFNFTKE
jgi:hypothetical protein